MHPKKILSRALCLLLLGSPGVQAQTTVTAAGGNSSGSGGSSSYSLGQVEFFTYSGSNGSEAQGVQQAFEISEVIGVAEIHDIALLASVYPNPGSDHLTLLLENVDLPDLSYQLTDMPGKNYLSGPVQSPQTSIDMSGLVSASYCLRILHKQNVIKTFIIIKN